MSDEVDRYRNLVNLLYNKSISKSLDWKNSPWTNRLSVNIGNYRVEIDTGEESDGTPVEIIYILNASNQIVDSFNDNELSGEETGVDGYDNYWLLMKRIHHLAHRKSKKSDEAIENILRNLNNDQDF
ncbi:MULTISPECIES: hypothetical protein [unclassified Sphingobium]|uniref:hypothetical protein n=1 Tax=unclassified Sphingobium TaxID=2611147 RepID=UPI002224CEFD|nr:MULTISPECIES: hypothetical protein [unclassified Sphingobium]MCW2380983.1 hypothetical protein [Sphingobium sp. B2D3B]MCW2388875.1 hypothetical protein [Sphingobium sp. B11D3B]MCW2398911.1 hypothetical protein [Sphingobium sp. B2D3C]